MDDKGIVKENMNVYDTLVKQITIIGITMDEED